MATKPKPFKVPKSLAACADLLYTTREARLKLSKEVEAMEKQEAALKLHLIDNLPKSQATGVSGKVANAKIVTADEPQVEDWPKFYDHIRKTKAFELLNRALNKAAVKERWENRKEVPGVKHFTIVKVSITKVS